MFLPIVRHQVTDQPRSTFTVRVGPLTLTPQEADHLERYGADLLDIALAAYDGLAKVLRTQVTVPFPDATQAQQSVDAIHAACAAQKAYWEAASTFTGDKSYGTPP